MAKKIEMTFGEYEGLAKIKKSRGVFRIRYDSDYTRFSQFLVMASFFFVLYLMVAGKGKASLVEGAVAVIMGPVCLLWFIRVLAFILGPFGKFLYGHKEINFLEDVVYAQGEASSAVVTSKAGVAAKMASLAMAGAMSEEGKKVGRNIYLGAAALIPSTSRVSGVAISFIHRNGEMGVFTVDKKIGAEIVKCVNQEDLKLASEYLSYLRDSRRNPVACLDEVSRKLSGLISDLARKSDLSKSAETVKERSAAFEACELISKKIRLYGVLKSQIAS